MKRLYFILALVLSLSMLLASCAQPTTPAPTQAPQVQPTSAPTAAPAQPTEAQMPTEPPTSAPTTEPTMAPTAAPAAEQVLVAGLDVGPGGYNNGMVYNYGAGHTMHEKMYSPLFVFNDDSTAVVPFIVDSFSHNDDFTVWTFKLRNDVRFSDGQPLTTKDVQFTAEFMTDPQINLQNMQHVDACYGNIKGYEAKRNGDAKELEGLKVIDDYTFEWTLSKPNPFQYGSMVECYILPQHAIDFSPADYQTVDWWYNPDKQVGSGPFHVSAYVKDQYLELVPNEYYFKGKPKLTKLVDRYFPDETAAVLALAAGEIDFSYISPNVIPTLDQNKFTIFSGNSYVSIFFHPNYNKLPDAWKDVRVRQAFMYAIDRQAIAEQILGGTSKVIPCDVPIEGAWPAGLNDYAYDPAKAKDLLAQAGVNPADLGKIDMITHPGYADQLSKDAIQAIISYLGDVGIQAEMRFLDLATWRATFPGGDFGMGYRGLGLPIFTPSYAVIDSNGGTQGGDVIGYDFKAEGFEAALDAVNTATDMDGYTAALGNLCKLENEKLPYLYMFVGNRFGAANKEVKNFYWFPAPAGGPYDDHAEQWYIQK